jgi:hypothetical protein
MADERKPAIQQAKKAAQAKSATKGINPRPTADTLERNPQINRQYQQSIGRTPPPPPPPQGPDYFLENYSMGGGRGGGGGPKPPIDFRDAAYNAQIASLNRALQDFETGTRSSTQRYGEDFMQGLRSLGFRTGEGFQAAPDVTKYADEASAMAALNTPAARMAARRPGTSPTMPGSEPVGGEWDYEGAFNPFSAASRGTRTSRDEFAGRGTLRSSDFAKSYAEFQDRLNQQLEAMTSGRSRFLEDAARGVMQQRAGTQESIGAAEREARTRAAIRAAGGIV